MRNDLVIDERLLMLLPFFKGLALMEDPDLGEITDEQILVVTVDKLLEAGQARNVRLKSGKIRVELTDAYLLGPALEGALRWAEAQYEIDERLLVFAPLYQQLWLRDNRETDPAKLTDVVARVIQVAALLEIGDAKIVLLESGRIRIEPTDDYLRRTFKN